MIDYTLETHFSIDRSSPLTVLCTYEDEWKEIYASLKELNVPDAGFIVLHGFDWNKYMSPWKADAVFKSEPAFDGRADEFIVEIAKRIIPDVIKANGLTPSAIYIAGYSMAGLFALYSLYNTDLFDGAASCSGSLWYPKFIEYAKEKSFVGNPSKIYLSVGDKEAKTRNPVMAAVEDNTRALYGYYKSMELDVSFELNSGNHFADVAMRTAKGISSILT